MSTDLQKLVIVGTGPNAKNAYKFIRQYELFEVLCFTVDEKYMEEGSFQNLPVYPLEKIESYVNVEEVQFFIALFWNHLNADRRSLYTRLKVKEYKLANLISPSASILSSIVGDNCWIQDYVVIQNDTVIGSNVFIMPQSVVCDHTAIGNHCFLAAHSTVGGGCTIGDQTFIGLNCTVFDDTKIGKKCILGASTAVKRNMPDYSLYKTSSDHLIRKYSEDTIESKLVFSRNVRN